MLFVCTGNICRSPMAAAMAADLLGRDGPPAASAGVLAIDGAPATPAAASVCEEIGVDVAGHRARQLTAELAAEATAIYVMTGAQRRRVLEIAPEVVDRVELLRPDGRDVEDPYGLPVEVYRATRDEIAAALQERFGG